MQPTEFARVVNIDAGRVMVVTDLHGDWNAYRHCRDRFLTLQAHGEADILLFTGDLIHSDGPAEEDQSLAIVMDVLALREQLGDRLIYLLGNHELPHLYGLLISKGERVYTPRFEAVMGDHRPQIMALFDSLPFYARTRAGVALCHTGAAAEISSPTIAFRLFNHSHRRLWEEITARAPASARPALRLALSESAGAPYEMLVRDYLAVSGPEDPRYDDFLLGSLVADHPSFRLLWTAFFNRNEQWYGRQEYLECLDALLTHLSSGYIRQRTLVTGHIVCQDGHEVVVGRQLRIASGVHARPYRSARYLLFDAGQTVYRAVDLLADLHYVFE